MFRNINVILFKVVLFGRYRPMETTHFYLQPRKSLIGMVLSISFEDIFPFKNKEEVTRTGVR